MDAVNTYPQKISEITSGKPTFNITILVRNKSHFNLDKVKYTDRCQTLERGSGTCSEYANVYVAIMRNMGIPARFISGYIYGEGYHAWAEFYLKGYGWIPVDPQLGRTGIVDQTPLEIAQSMPYRKKLIERLKNMR